MKCGYEGCTCKVWVLGCGLGITDTQEKNPKNASATAVVFILERSVFLSLF